MAIELYRTTWVIIAMPTLPGMDRVWERWIAWKQKNKHTWKRYL
jgi:hypothetical protein